MTRARTAQARGFALVFAIVISVVMTGLVTAVVLRVLTDQKVGRNVARQLASREDADLALRFAETEILTGMDKMLLAFWTVNGTFSPAVQAGHYSADTTRTFSELDINSEFPAQTEAAMLRHRPLLQLTLLGNPRNWPAFCDWQTYKGTWNPADKDFPALTRYWRLVPRDSNIDDDWYTGEGVGAQPFPVIIAQRKDAKTGAMFPSEGYMTTVSLGGDPRDGQKAVKHSFWYEQLLPVTAGAAKTGLPATPAPTVPGPSPTPIEAKYIQPESTYRPTGEQWPNRVAEYPADMNLLDTPFYKKIYQMPSGSRVAVYCRLDLREYLAGDAATLGVDQRRSDRLLRFYLAAVTEGRVDGKGDTKSFKPSEITGKYIYISSGGMELKALNVSRESVETELGANTVPPDFNWYPGVLDNVGRTLAAGSTISGQVFRADGNRGYMLASHGAYQSGSVPVTPAPGDMQEYYYPDGTVNTFRAPPMQTFFYLWEDARPDKTNTTTAYVEANTNFIWLSYDRANPADRTKWRWRRTPFVNPLLEPPLVRNPPPGQTPSPSERLVDSPNSIVSSTSGFIDRHGYFEVWPRGDAADGANVWTGPKEGNEYYLSSDDSFTRTGSHLQATGSFR